MFMLGVVCVLLYCDQEHSLPIWKTGGTMLTEDKEGVCDVGSSDGREAARSLAHARYDAWQGKPFHFATNTAFVDTTLTHTFAKNLIVGVNKALVRFRDGA